MNANRLPLIFICSYSLNNPYPWHYCKAATEGGENFWHVLKVIEHVSVHQEYMIWKAKLFPTIILCHLLKGQCYCLKNFASELTQ